MRHKPPKGIKRRLLPTGGRNQARHTLLFKYMKPSYFTEIGPEIRRELERLPVGIINPEFRTKRASLVLGRISDIMNKIITKQIISKMKLNERQRKQLSELARRHVELIIMHPKKMYSELTGVPNAFHLPHARKKINEALEIMEKTSKRKQLGFGSVKARKNFQKEWEKIFKEAYENAMVGYNKRDIIMLQNVVDLEIEKLLGGRKQAFDFITEIEWVEDILSNELKDLIAERKIKIQD